MTDQRPTWAQARRARTFEDAKTAISRLAPRPGAPAAERRAYHLLAAEVYREVARVDTRHRHEAQAYATVEETIYAPKAQ